MPRPILRAPPRRLLRMRHDDHKAKIGYVCSALNHSLGCKGIKALRAPGIICNDMVITVKPFNGLNKPFVYVAR